MAVLVSVVSFWEISLKYSIGRFDLGNVTPDNFPALVRQSGFDILPLADTERPLHNSSIRAAGHISSAGGGVTQ
jgi:PIN domain nuclease of toxin-antitoxin system